MTFGEDIARACELNEAQAWRECVEGCAAVDGNPLRAEVGWASETPIPIVGALNFALFNRVISLGVASPATDDDLRTIAETYGARAQSNWAVSLSPLAEPADLGSRLEERNLRRGTDFAKVIRSTDAPPTIDTDLRIEEIGPEHTDEFVAVNLAAFDVPPPFSPWFAGTLGRPGWRHYIGFDGSDPVSTGALYLSGSIGWLGFGATLPSQRKRGGQGAIMARRIRDAATLGCEFVHTETGAETAASPNPSYRNMIRTGFELAYLRPNYTPAPAGDK